MFRPTSLGFTINPFRISIFFIATTALIEVEAQGEEGRRKVSWRQDPIGLFGASMHASAGPTTVITIAIPYSPRLGQRMISEVRNPI